jgi:hypothetical protein
VTVEERYAAAERSLDAARARRIRRTPVVLIGLIGALVLLVAVTAAIDLRRLQTPRGAALAWTSAATLGECRGYLALSRPVEPLTERRTDEQICRALRAATGDARARGAALRITPLQVRQDGRSAVVALRVRRGETSYDVRLHLVRQGAHWRVLRDQAACAAVGCP